MSVNTVNTESVNADDVDPEARARAALALAAGVPASAVPAVGGPPALTVTALLDDPGFQSEVAREREALRTRGVALFAEMLLATDQAFRNIHEALDPTHPDYGAKARLETSRWVVESVLPAKKLVAEVAVAPTFSPELAGELVRVLDAAERRAAERAVVVSLDDDPHLLDK